MSILLTSKYHEKYDIFGDYYYNKELFHSVGKKYEVCLFGDLVDITISDIIKALESGDYSVLTDSYSEYSAIVLDNERKTVNVVTDVIGRHLLYVYEDQEFILSSDLFTLANEIKRVQHPLEIDIDEALCQIFLFASPAHRTYLKGVEIVSPATVLTKQDEKHSERHVYFIFDRKNIGSNKEISEKEKIDRLFCLFDDYFKHLSSKYGTETFGVGISGGLDSRIIPYFALKHNLNLEPFIICESREKGKVESNDFTRATEISNYFGISLSRKSSFPKSENFNEAMKARLSLDCLNAPLTASQLFKLPTDESFGFNSLITGASGFIVGSSPFYESTKFANIIDVLRQRQTGLKLRPKFFRVKKAVNYFVPDLFSLDENLSSDILRVIKKDDINTLIKSIKTFLEKDSNEKNRDARFDSLIDIDTLAGQEKTDAMMNYAVNVLGQRNLAGGFESLGGTKRSYTLYNGRILKEVQSWSEEDIYDRKLFENLIRYRLPELATIKAQTHKSSLSQNKNGFFQQFRDIVSFAIRGQGVMNYDNWYRDRKFQKFINSEINDMSPINSILNFDQLNKLVLSKKINSIVALNALKLNYILTILGAKYGQR